MLQPRSSLLVCTSVLLVLASACSTTKSAQDDEIETLDGPDPEQSEEPDPIGIYLADINASINAWTQLTMTARDEQQRRNARLLEKDLMRRTYKRRDELIYELESGPPSNRIIAASALGFTRAPEAHSPLIAALDDPVEDVRSNALLGLSLLARADTPLDRVCELLRVSDSAWVRNNAALCGITLVNAGARSDCLLEGARLGLIDSEPGVRSQCALILATLVDSESLESLETLLYDDTPLVASAAARSIAYIGSEDPHARSEAALLLYKAYAPSEDPMRQHFIAALVELSGRLYGDDVEEWRDWAQRLQ